MFGGNPQRVAVAGSQQLWLALFAAMPHRADGVDHKLCRQAVALGELRFADLASVQQAAFAQQLRSGGTVDRPVHAAAAQQRRIGGIDNRIDHERGDVGLQDTQCGVHG